jgi:divinyl protochlorophyllide a 8-vinyl-reductase
MTAVLPGSLTRPAAPGMAAPARVGPNAVIQLELALCERYGEDTARAVFAAAGQSHLLGASLDEMVDERVVAELFHALYARLPEAAAAAVAARAGTRTAEYLLANRIPSPVRGLLPLLPAALSARLLLRAVTANAWTFAGSGRFRALAGSPHVVEIAYNPVAMPGCVWHVAVFEGLFRALVSPRTRVRHTQCCHLGAKRCRFEVHVAPAGPFVLRGNTP